MKRGFGCLPDAPSARGSHALEQLCAAPIALSADWSHLADPAVDQGSTSTCFAHAWASALAQCMRAKGLAFERPSALLIADMAKGVSGTRGLDVGCSLGATELAVRWAGFAPESAVPWRESEVCREIWADEYQGAILQVGTRSHRVTSDVRVAVSAAISSGCGVVIGIDVDQSFIDHRGGAAWSKMTGARLGGHALSVCGYSDTGVKVLNSWGTDWGENGFGWISWDYIESDHCGSIWVVDAAPEYWREAA